nr:bifunctional diguanylate cyclase/phosphodiesterase [Dechloromonas sp.]
MTDRPRSPRLSDAGSPSDADGQRDPITGFLNRDAGLLAAQRAVADASARHAPLAALWLDIDRFRQINDSFGHPGGDSVIVRIAERIRDSAHPGCDLLRMGSDEFVALVPGCDRPSAEAMARRLLEAIELPMPIDKILVRPSASVGIALLQQDEDASRLLERADRAMIEAKRQGGNRLVVSACGRLSGRLGIQLAREELAIEGALHAALESGGLQLAYQPIIGIDGRVEAVEALMRCHALGMLIPPEKFIPVAEKTGLIVRLGEWSLLQGAHCAASLRRQGHATRVAINVSRAQLTSPTFLQALHGALICANTAAEQIELELTESLFMDLSATVQANLRGAREAGVALAIDDFGTGYSSLANLKDLPATKLKFDRAFIGVLPDDRRAFAIVKAMTLLAHDLGMLVVAEGVENTEQRAACIAAGVDATQGYCNARPMPEAALLQWMKTREGQ